MGWLGYALIRTLTKFNYIQLTISRYGVGRNKRRIFLLTVHYVDCKEEYEVFQFQVFICELPRISRQFRYKNLRRGKGKSMEILINSETENLMKDQYAFMLLFKISYYTKCNDNFTIPFVDIGEAFISNTMFM